MTHYADRRDAGRALARALEEWQGREVVVLALPRGGVPVAAEVAHVLGAPLDVFVVRKLGFPGQPELAMGAIASGGVQVLNEPVARMVSETELAAVVMRETAEIERRERDYRGDRSPVTVSGRTVVLVDDGLATGATMRAAVGAVRRLSPAEVIVAVPVGASSAVRALEQTADRVVCPVQPPAFNAVGQFYEDFRQTTDDEVRAALAP
jgi:putative phosphoribosyl transferase